MASKRELEEKLKQVNTWRLNALTQRDEAQRKAERYARALDRVAKHYGFHEAYVREKRSYVDHIDGPIRVCQVFSPNALIADLDAIDKAAAADEARARLGIGDAREGE